MILKSIFNFIIYFSREVEYSEGEKIKNNYDVDFFMETSAKSGFNVMKLFCDAAKILFEDSMKKREVNKVRKK